MFMGNDGVMRSEGAAIRPLSWFDPSLEVNRLDFLAQL